MLTICDDPQNHRECKVVGLCGDCKHWDRSRTDNGTGICAAIPHLGSMVYDHKVALSDRHDLKAGTRDLTNDDSELITKADFGCVIFEPKP